MTIGVIPAAGRGTRTFPLSSKIQKVMLDVGGKPLLQRNVELLRDQLDSKLIYIIVGHLGQQIKKHFGDGSDFDVEIEYVTQKEPDGIGAAVHITRRYITKPFFVLLGDEFYMGSNHRDVLALLKKKINAVCGFRYAESKSYVRENYTGKLNGNRILSLEEKPKRAANMHMGCGTYFFNPVIYQYLKKTPPSSVRGEIELTDAINNLAKSESGVYAFFLEGDYVNVNSMKDLQRARKLIHQSERKCSQRKR